MNCNKNIMDQNHYSPFNHFATSLFTIPTLHSGDNATNTTVYNNNTLWSNSNFAPYRPLENQTTSDKIKVELEFTKDELAQLVSLLKQNLPTIAEQLSQRYLNSIRNHTIPSSILISILVLRTLLTFHLV